MTRRLVTHQNPEGRETPLLLLAQLRTIDETLELVYFGKRDWRLGSVKPNDERTFRGDRILAFEDARDPVHRNPKNLYLGALLKEGFAQIAQYFDMGDPSGAVKDAHGNITTIFEDMQQRQQAWTIDGGEDAFKQSFAVTIGDEKKAEAEATMKQYVATDGRAHYHREMRNRVMFGPAGMTGGSGRIITP
jgi:hypothetical protein